MLARRKSKRAVTLRIIVAVPRRSMRIAGCLPTALQTRAVFAWVGAGLLAHAGAKKGTDAEAKVPFVTGHAEMPREWIEELRAAEKTSLGLVAQTLLVAILLHALLALVLVDLGLPAFFKRSHRSFVFLGVRRIVR